MSQAALITATVQTLQALFVGPNIDPANICDEMMDGQPKPSMGERFIAVHDGGWSGQSQDYDLDELFGVAVTYTRKLGSAPQDRWGPKVWRDKIEPDLRAIIVALHHSYAVMAAANVIISATTPLAPFIEPLLFLDAGKRELKGPEWFSSHPDHQGRVTLAGVAQTLTFGRARRVQAITEMG